MLTKLTGLVLRTTDINDNDRMITFFSAEEGKVSVCGKGVRSVKSPHMACVQPFAYAEYVVYRKGDMRWLKESSLSESFFSVRSTLEGAALASYVTDAAGEFALEGVPDLPLLRLALNTLHLIAQNKKPLPLIKAAFELRAAALSGYSPELDGCTVCGRDEGEMCLELVDGILVCRKCEEKERIKADAGSDLFTGVPILRNTPTKALLTRGTLDAMRHISSCEDSRVFAFTLPEDELSCLSRVCEGFILNQLERGFSTLDFYNSVKTVST